MRLWHILQSRLRSIFFRHRRESDLKEELRLHLDREIERLRESGLSLDDARLRARRIFGGVEQMKEECRDARRIVTWDAVGRETRQSLRRLIRDWRFSGAVVLILGLAIGANTAVFSLVNAVLFRKQATVDPGHLVNIYQNDRSGKPMIVTSYGVYKEIAAYTDVFAGAMAASVPSPSRYLHDGALRNAAVEFATASYLDVVGLQPSVGRWFDETEERTGAPLVGVLGYQTWTRVFHADRSIVGRIIRVEGAAVTIVGVAPADHRGTLDLGLATDLWLPMTAFPAIFQDPAMRAAPTIYAPLLVKARLRPGVTVAQARAAMDVLGRRLEAEHPEDFRRSGEFALGSGMTVLASTDVRIHPQADVPFMVLGSLALGIVGLVLAIAASNLATLLLVRSTARAKEVCVRLALGATRRQVVWHQLSESLMLALAGGVVGCILAWWGVTTLQGVDLPITLDVTLDYRVLAFAIVLALLTGVSFGLTPALKATRVDLVQTLRADGWQSMGHRRLTLQNGLVIVQVAVSVLLLGGTSTFLQMLQATKAHRVEYAVNGVALLETDLRFSGAPKIAATTVYDNLLPRIRAIPGVESVALLRGLPMEANSTMVVIDRAAADDGAGVEATIVDAGPGFFDTLRIPLLYGRVFDARDRADTPRVAVITDRMALRYFDAVNAVGRRFRLSNDVSSWTEVIGVVHDTGTGDFDNDVLDPIAPPFFRSYTQSGAPPTTVVARTSGDAATLLSAMQRELRAVDLALPVVTATTMAQRLERSQAAPKTIATFLGVLAGLGLVLASTGLYAVVGFAVARRSREIGIRMALGARSPQVAWSIARGVAALMGIGTAVGLLLSVLAMLLLRAFGGSGDIGIGNLSVYQPNINPMELAAIAVVMTVVGVAAGFVPARRATRLDPLVALRHQ